MTYFPPSFPAIPNPTAIPLNWGSVQNSPIMQAQGYASNPYGIAAPTIQAPIATPPVTQGLYNQLSNGAGNLGQAPSELSASGLNLGALPADLVPGGAETAGRLGLRGALSGIRGRLTSPEFLGPAAVSLAGQLITANTRPGTAPHVAGTALATGGTTAGIAGLGLGVPAVAALGLPALPIEAGALAGGAGGSLINHWLGSGGGTDFGPFHWHNGQGAVAHTQFNDPGVDHLISVATDQFQSKNIGQRDFATIVKQAELANQMGQDPKTIAQNIATMIPQAVQLQQARIAQNQQAATSHHDQLLQQAAIAKLLLPQMADTDQANQALAASERATRGSLSGGVGPIADLIANQTVSQGRRANQAALQSVLAYPQIQSLIQAIQNQNAAQQAANYYAARQSAATSGSNAQSLQQQLAGSGLTVTGAGGASGG